MGVERDAELACRLISCNEVLEQAANCIDRVRKSLLELPQEGRISVAGMQLAAARDSVGSAIKQLTLKRKKHE